MRRYEAELRATLTDWSAMLNRDASEGRRALRRVLRGPVYVKQESDGGWSFRGKGTFGGMLHEVFGVQVPDEEIERMNAALDRERDCSLPVPARTSECSGWCAPGVSR